MYWSYTSFSDIPCEYVSGAYPYGLKDRQNTKSEQSMSGTLKNKCVRKKQTSFAVVYIYSGKKFVIQISILLLGK